MIHPSSTPGKAGGRREEPMPGEREAGAVPAGPDARLVEQLRQGDAEAGHQFVREHYAGIYRYLLYLTGRREAAEDLTQQTFLQAWRRLETFDGRGPLRPWLHRIAHREFLQAVRSQHSEASLEEIPEGAAPRAVDLTEGVELRVVLARLPREDREVLVLHYLEGYRYQEIARIVGAPVTTVKYRLATARAHLHRELGEGDLTYLNQAPEAVLRRWAWLPLEALTVLEARMSIEGERAMRDNHHAGMSRRKLLGAAGSAAAAAAASLAGPVGASAAPNEAEIVDDRLTRKLSLGVKAMALADLCEQLDRDSGIAITAGPSVADEKVTLFCEKLPLREVMRQLSRPFGYTWLRTGKPGGYRYELVQELRSQLLEEELRNRDRNGALLILEREIERYRPYLELSPDEALVRARTAGPEEKPLLERIGRSAWGPVQMYFRLTPQQLAALRAGEELHFSQSPAKPGELPLPSDLAWSVLASLRDVYYHRYPDGFGLSTGVEEPKEGDLPPSAVPEARATVNLSIRQTELGRIALKGAAGTFSESDLPRNSGGGTQEGDGSLAIGISPAVDKPDNRAANARLAGEPDLQRPISVTPARSCGDRSSAFGARSSETGLTGATPKAQHPTPNAQHPTPEERVTSADVLEAIHRAAGLPIVSDFYTHLYAPEALAVREQPLFDALNRLADSMHLRWSLDRDALGESPRSAGQQPWLQLRSASFYDDRLKEVPNRLLSRWAAARRERGMLSLDDLCEIAQLSDAQLDAEGMAEGARVCFGLTEWELARNHNLRPHLRFLAELTPAPRQEAASPSGLAFARMTLPQQQRYIALALRFDGQALQSLDELAGAIMRVVYTQPGEFMWLPPGPNWYQWVVPVVPGVQGTRTVMPPVVGRTRDAALAAARQIDQRLLELILPEARCRDPHVRTASQVPDAGEIQPTDLELTIVYVPGLSNRRDISLVATHADFHNGSW